MAYETKVILRLLADRIADADDLEEAYESVVNAATVEGMKIPKYPEARQKILEKRKERNK